MSFSQLAHQVFDGENYQLGTVRMETYLEALDLWEAVEEDYEFFRCQTIPRWPRSRVTRKRKPENQRRKQLYLQAQEKRRLMRQDCMVEGALATNLRTQSKGNNAKKNYSPYQHCGKKDAQVVNEEEEDHLFMATILSIKKSDFWLIDSGCTNHMTYDKNLFKEFTSMGNKKVRIGNGDYILTKGKGIVAIPTKSGTKKSSDVLYVPDIDQNLLSVGQLMKKEFKVSFEDKHCFIYDATGLEILRVKMRGKNFSFNPTEDEK
ncbi:uncharacterized protein [Nicotiana sylvestris]|uniref:uncharacterized protein n=1 Tax=Nicotiana sylvestris TaxID=4096 RepID=UPI00388CEAA3